MSEIVVLVECGVVLGALALGDWLFFVRALVFLLDVFFMMVVVVFGELRRCGVVVLWLCSGMWIGECLVVCLRSVLVVLFGVCDLVLGNFDFAFLLDLVVVLHVLLVSHWFYGDVLVFEELVVVVGCDIGVVSGAFDGIECVLVVYFFLGDIVVVEDLGWLGVIDVVWVFGLWVVGACVDVCGMVLEDFEWVLRVGVWVVVFILCG